MADLDELKKAWQSQRGISEERFDQIGDQVREGTTLLQSTIFRRDLAETFAALVVVAFFAPGLFAADNWLSRSGFAIEVLACITIPLVLWWGRKRTIETVSSANFCDFLDIEIDYLHRQIRLLRMILWWYLLPIYVGIVLITLGHTDLSRPTLVSVFFVSLYLSICTVLFVYIWWLNQNARRKHFEPLLAHYVAMRTAVESGDDFEWVSENSRIAFLRQKPRPPMSTQYRAIWILLTGGFTVLVFASGVALMQWFDRRTGLFVASTAPVAGLLLIILSGIWRRNRR